MLRLSRARAPPAIMANTAAATQMITDSVSSQPSTSSTAGSVNRKKFSGLPKMGSATGPAACGAYQNSASVGQSEDMDAPLIPAMMIEATMPTMRSTGSTEKLT